MLNQYVSRMHWPLYNCRLNHSVSDAQQTNCQDPASLAWLLLIRWARGASCRCVDKQGGLPLCVSTFVLWYLIYAWMNCYCSWDGTTGPWLPVHQKTKNTLLSCFWISHSHISVHTFAVYYRDIPEVIKVSVCLKHQHPSNSLAFSFLTFELINLHF